MAYSMGDISIYAWTGTEDVVRWSVRADSDSGSYEYARRMSAENPSQMIHWQPTGASGGHVAADFLGGVELPSDTPAHVIRDIIASAKKATR